MLGSYMHVVVRHLVIKVTAWLILGTQREIYVTQPKQPPRLPLCVIIYTKFSILSDKREFEFCFIANQKGVHSLVYFCRLALPTLATVWNLYLICHESLPNSLMILSVRAIAYWTCTNTMSINTRFEPLNTAQNQDLRTQVVKTTTS